MDSSKRTVPKDAAALIISKTSDGLLDFAVIEPEEVNSDTEESLSVVAYGLSMLQHALFNPDAIPTFGDDEEHFDDDEMALLGED